MKQRQSSITSISENSTTVNLTLLNETATTEEGKNEETKDNMPNNSTTQKGLPGFLRRSLRNNYDEDSTTRTIPPAERPSLASTNNTKSSNSIKQSNSMTTTTTVGTSFSENNNDSNIKKETSKSTNNINNSDIKKDSSNSRLDSVSSQDASTAGDNNRPNLKNKSEKSYKLREFEKCINANIVDLRELRKLAWNSVPPEYRAVSWQILLEYLPANSSRRKTTLERKRQEYRDAIAQHYDIDDQTRTVQEQETLRQVLVDVPRTSPDIGLFRSNRIRRILARLLYIWAMRHPASSYVQGINDLVTPLISVFLSSYYGGKDMTDGTGIEEVPESILFEVEADAYWCLTKLLNGIQDHYTCDQPGVQRMVARLEELVQRIDSDLCEYLHETGIEFMQFSFKWMNCLLLREFSLQCIFRLWDTYISEGDRGFEDFHVYVCAAFLCQFSSEIQEMEFDELFGFMQNIPTSEWGDAEVEVLLSQAFVLSTLFGGSDAHLANVRHS